MNPQVRLSSRYLQDEEENGIVDFIWRECLILCICFNDNDCIEINTNAFLEMRHYENLDIVFTIWNGYLLISFSFLSLDNDKENQLHN